MKLVLSILISVALLSSPASGASSNTEFYEGYTLFSPNSSRITYLIDMDGDVVHTWESESTPGNSVYLLEDGNLLRTESFQTKESRDFPKGGAGGRVKIIDWDSNTLWQYELSDKNERLHHDVEYMPNGNVLMIVWERFSGDDVVKMGRDPKKAPENMFIDKIIEVKPDFETGGAEIVWQWRFADHLIQDFDKSKDNFGTVSENPGRIDINLMNNNPKTNSLDWTHINAVDYNEKLDQIIISSPTMSEIYIINHNITTEEAVGEKGDFMFRWGNPVNYDKGTIKDRKLFFQHDAQWITDDCPGTGNILVFNNGIRNIREYSTVDEIKLEITDDGSYETTNGRFLPENSVWSYSADDKSEFYSDHISGAQRLPNGNTLICSGAQGWFFEVTEEGKIVWEYVNTFGKSPPSQKPRPNDIDLNAIDSPKEVFRCTRYPVDYPGL